MLIVKDKPVGIDFYIQTLQKYLYERLVSIWKLNQNNGDDEYQSYGRVYRNIKDNGYIAEAYVGDKQYKEVYWDEKLKAISFFGISNNIKRDILDTADVHLVYFVNVAKLKPAIPHRADEEIRTDVSKLFGKSLLGFSMQNTDLWLDNVLKEYPGSRRDERLKSVDMHPVHCFRLNLRLNYDPNKIC